MKTEQQRSAGGLVVRGGEVLLIAVQGGRRWQLPKGHIELGETPEQAAVREVEEETGVRGRLVDRLPSIDFWFLERGRRVHKTVDYFLLDYVGGSANDFDRHEVSEARWFSWAAAVDRLTFDNEREVVRGAWEVWRDRLAPDLGGANAATGPESRSATAGAKG